MGADFIPPVRGRYLLLHLADRTYAVPTLCIEEILPMAEVTPVPGAPPFLTGFLDVGGELAAVVSMRRLFGMPPRDWDLYTPLVLLKAAPQPIAMEVDEVTCIVDIDDDHLIPVADGYALNDCASALARVDGRAVVLLSPERMLLEQERRRVAELAESVRRRAAELETVTA
jgi:purine-binding chemotaxis protein CheW